MDFNSQIHENRIPCGPCGWRWKPSASGPRQDFGSNMNEFLTLEREVITYIMISDLANNQGNKSEISQPIFQRASAGGLLKLSLFYAFSHPQVFTKEKRKITEPPYYQTLSNPFIIQDHRAAVKTQPHRCAYSPCAWQSKQFHLPALQRAGGDK